MTPDIDKAAAWIVETLEQGGMIFACGNGGSASQAEHFVAELIGIGWPAVALTSPSSVTTALLNDHNPLDVFKLHLHAFDGLHVPRVLLGISTSGNSRNVLRAMESAPSIFLTGPDPYPAEALTIKCEGANTQRIQEEHERVIHYFYEEVQRCLS